MPQPPIDAYEHVFRHEADLPAEAAILADVVSPGSRLLDVGTGATGRTALLAQRSGAEVVSIEINQAALAEFAASGKRGAMALAAADMTRLPMTDASFDTVLIAFHGLDYLLDPTQRRQALQESARVLRSGGSLVVNSWNRWGIICSPRGLRSSGARRIRLRYFARGDVFSSTLTDGNGLRLHQSTPARLKAEVAAATDLEFASIVDSRSGSRSGRVTLFDVEPYYVFTRP